MALSIVIIGAGALGTRVAELRTALGDRVFTLRRSASVAVPGVQALSGDLHDTAVLAQLPAAPDVLVFCASPDARHEAAYRTLYIQGFERCVAVVAAKRTIFISSTAVYAQNSGEWVDEQSPALAQTFNGRVLREAEQICWQQASSVVLRLSGIAGPGRHQLINKALIGEGLAHTWSNRIHSADAAQAVSYLISHPAPQMLYIGSDDQPVLQMELANWIRSKHHLPALALPDGPASGRRVCNARLKNLGWKPHFSSYRDMY